MTFFRVAHPFRTGSFLACCWAVWLVGWSSSALAQSTAQLSHSNPAGLSPQWQYEGTAFYMMRGPSANLKTVPVYRLEHPTRGFLLTTSKEEAAAAERTGFKSQGIAFQAPVDEGTAIHRYKLPGNGAFFYAATADEASKLGGVDEGVAFHAYQAGSTRTTGGNGADLVPVSRYKSSNSDSYVFTAAHESPYQVGAYYFGSFSPAAKGIIDGTRRVYDRDDDWWGGVRDFHEGKSGDSHDTRGWQGSWTELKPAIGYYDQRSTTVLAKQIEQAADAGLTFFSFYWYWSDAKNGELFPDALQQFLKANTAGKLKFNLSLYAHPWSEDMAINSSNSDEVIRKLVDYFAMANYLRLPDGRPVFVMGDHRNIRGPDGKMCAVRDCDVKAVGDFLTKLKRASAQRLKVEPFVEMQPGAPGWDSVSQVDAITCLVPPIDIKGGMPYPKLDPSVFDVMAKPGKPVSPCMFENFDERPRQDILIKDRSVVRYFVGKTDEGLRRNLEAAKQYSDQEFAKTGNPAARIIYLYAWNEWHEGGILEPNAATGAKDLNIVTDVFHLPRTPSKCLDKGEC